MIVPALAVEADASNDTGTPGVGEAVVTENAAVGATPPTSKVRAVPMLVPSAANTVRATV